MIVVTAASGALGRIVVEQLLTRHPDRPVVAAVRDPGRAADLAARGALVRRGDYDDPASLRDALRGAERLLLISSPVLDTEVRVRQHRAAIDAAVDAGVRAFAYTSFLGADRGGDGPNAAHHATERALAGSGLPATILRHPFYTEAFVNPGLRDAVTSGTVTHGTGGRGLNTALRADLAVAAATVLTSDEYLGRAYDLTGPLWTYQDLAAVLGELSGRPVEPVETTVAPPLGFLMQLAKAGLLERQTADLAALLGRPPTPLRDAVAAALG
ncbi:NAD(P)H-binding protein [Dactylosporangium aurantiacum]|uniref:NAD(P)H-binding protein n=1 Tax=Dactylosporangium aurantiacum TaxID=35754 RepID=A0A9Q9MIG2_9ACTN|nr:NAD(P)H-binding protein [Dactylosporangium aurantiacum]MDG6106781.1 NAD(P)H-binding protein [Dactylosporangium aurantiacum]UWZ50922.1 NAD(P)H-binding protein [Dactylosporangium aurantiacum]